MSRKLSPWCKKVKKKLIDLDMTTTELAEVMTNPRFYEQLGIDTGQAIADGVEMLERLYG